MLNPNFRGLVRRHWLINLNPYQAELWNSVHTDRQQYEDADKLQEYGVLGNAQADRWHHKWKTSGMNETFKVRIVWKMLNLRHWWGSHSSWIWSHMFCEIGTDISVEFSAFVFRRGNIFKMEPASKAVSCPQKPRTFILWAISVVFLQKALCSVPTRCIEFPLNLPELRGTEWRLCPVTTTGRWPLSWSSYHEIVGGGRRENRKTEF